MPLTHQGRVCACLSAYILLSLSHKYPIRQKSALPQKKSILYSYLPELHHCRQQAPPMAPGHTIRSERETEASGVKAGALNCLYNVLYTLKEFKNGCLQGAACHLDDLLQHTCIYYKTPSKPMTESGTYPSLTVY